MAKYAIGQRVRVYYDPSINAAAVGDPEHVPGAFLAGFKGEAIITDMRPPRREGLQDEYYIRFDDGQPGLAHETELEPIY